MRVRVSDGGGLVIVVLILLSATPPSSPSAHVGIQRIIRLGGHDDSKPGACLQLRGLRGLRGGGDDLDGGGKQWGGLNAEYADDELDGEGFDYEGEVPSPWPDQAGTREEEIEMAQGMKESLVMGQDKWYDDMYANVPKNQQGAYDMHADDEEGWEGYTYDSHVLDELKYDEENPEGYLGAVDEEGMKELYPHLKKKFAYYERNISYAERHPDHRFKVGDLVVLSEGWKDPFLGNYTSNFGREDVPEMDRDVPFNDAEKGPLFPDDVGIILQDDNSMKPYLVKALDSSCYRPGYPYEWTDQWYYIPEALRKYTVPDPLDLADDALVHVPQHYPSVKLALKNMTEGQSLLVHEGDYRFEEVIECGDHPEGLHKQHKHVRVKTLNITGTGDAQTGEGAARSWGRMVFGKWARGWWQNMVLLYTTSNSFKGIVEVYAGPWEFDFCELRCAGGIAIRTFAVANVSCAECGIGGFAWPIGPNAASDATYSQDSSVLLLQSCRIEKTGRVAGCGVYGRDKTKIFVLGCTLQQNDHAIGFDDKTYILVEDCKIHGNRNEAFYGGLRSHRGSTLVLRRNKVDGPVWFRARLPELLGLSSEYPGDNIMGPIPPQPRWRMDALNLTVPLLDDRIQKQRDWVPIHWDGNHDFGGG